MKPDIQYVYYKLKQLRFEFKESDRKLFPKDYRFDYGLDRYVRVDGNDLYISKDTFKPLEEELEYADRCHSLEEEIGCPLEVYVKLHQQKKFYRLNALNEIIECEIDNPNDDEVYHIQTDGIIFNQYDYGWQFYPFKDYKKTWWLKEDKSE